MYEAHPRRAAGIGIFLTLASNGIDALQTIGAEERALAAGFPTRDDNSQHHRQDAGSGSHGTVIPRRGDQPHPQARPPAQGDPRGGHRPRHRHPAAVVGLVVREDRLCGGGSTRSPVSAGAFEAVEQDGARHPELRGKTLVRRYLTPGGRVPKIEEHSVHGRHPSRIRAEERSAAQHRDPGRSFWRGQLRIALLGYVMCPGRRSSHPERHALVALAQGTGLATEHHATVEDRPPRNRPVLGRSAHAGSDCCIRVETTVTRSRPTGSPTGSGTSTLEVF